jgi:O-antigen/teichoic acid export membrane protein
MSRLRAALPKLSDFQRHLLVQSSGTVLSQLVPIIASPLLTRIYAPADFGLYGVVVSIATLLAIFITLRVDHGIIVSPSDDEAKKVAVLSLWLAVAGAAFFALAAAVTIAVIGASDWTHFFAWVVFGPLAALLAAATRTLTLFNNRLKHFALVSRARFAQAIVAAAASVLLGFLTFQAYGLVVALLIGNLLYVVMLGGRLYPFTPGDVASSLSIVKANAKFIRFSLPADLVNSLTARMPFIVFPALYGLEQTGYLALAYRVVATPARFVGTAIGEVFYSHAARDYERTGNCLSSARNVAVILGGIGLIGFAILFVTAEPLFAFAFGEEWRPAALFTQILTPMLFVSFVVSPLSVVFYIASRQKDDFLWQIVFLVATTAASFAGLLMGGMAGSLMAVSAVGVALYLVYLALIWRYAAGSTTARS